MKRILYIVQAPSGGVARHLIDLIDHLDKGQFSIGLICNVELEDKRFHQWRVNSKDVHFYDLPGLKRAISARYDFLAIIAVYRIIRKFRPDVVHAHSSKAGLVGRIAARLAGVRYIIYTPHAYAFMSPEFSAPKRKIFVLAEKILSHTCTDITINCSFSENEYAMKENIDIQSKFRVIQNAVPIGDNRKDFRVKENCNEKFIVANFARVSEQKNPDLFDQIADQVSRCEDGIEFRWYGLNPSNRTADHVKYCGQVEQPIIEMQEADLFLSTSLFEGLSYSLLEAESIGLPVLASNVPGNDEFIQMFDLAQGFELSDTLESISEKIINQFHSRAHRTSQPSLITDRFSKMMNEMAIIYSQPTTK